MSIACFIAPQVLFCLSQAFPQSLKPNAQKVETEGAFDNIIAFENPDKSIAILVHNDSSEQKNINIKIGGKTINPSLKPNTFNTFLIK